MATILSDFNFGASAGRREEYPYDDWFDGNIWQLHAGKDFHVYSDAMRVNLYNAAKRRGIKIRTSINRQGDVIVAKSTPLTTPKVKAKK